jgi:hypothetical protein
MFFLRKHMNVRLIAVIALRREVGISGRAGRGWMYWASVRKRAALQLKKTEGSLPLPDFFVQARVPANAMQLFRAWNLAYTESLRECP